MKFCITYYHLDGLAERSYIAADVYPVRCVTALPLAPFEPRSPAEAELMKEEECFPSPYHDGPGMFVNAYPVCKK